MTRSGLRGARRRWDRALPSQTAVAKCVLNALSPGRSRALVDAEGLPKVGGGLAGIAVLEVGPAESFQGSCLLEGHADVPRPELGHPSAQVSTWG
jgi:hypothetical protein